jgi:hypothetical protein
VTDVELFLKRNKAARKALKGNDKRAGGDFRSPECVAFLKEADIVVTNPPFSLFSEYVAQLMEYGKKFLIIGPKNAASPTRRYSRSSRTRNYGSGQDSQMETPTSAFPPIVAESLRMASMTRAQDSSSFAMSAGSQT